MTQENRQSPNPDPQNNREMDPRDLVYTGGPTIDPREAVLNPAVTPESIDDAEELRDDLQHDEE